MRTGVVMGLALASVASLTYGAVPPLDTVRVASGLSQPLYVTAAPGDTSRLFIVERGGAIKILNLNSGTVNPTPFISIPGLATGGNEQGLLGLAFDPDYASNGKLYVNVTAGGGAFGNGVTQIRQYSVSANPDVANTVFTTVLSYDQTATNHNGGWIGFSPRPGDTRNLYIASGDGGGSNDPLNNAQRTNTLLGKMLRITVNADGTTAIPANNPFAGSTDPSVRKEIFTYGLRNPYRASFDRITGDLFIGDVGQSAREEVDVQKASNPGGGENYGWRPLEGTLDNGAVADAHPPGAVPPIIEYPRTIGRTVIGGYVYRGQDIPGLAGTYIFGDYLGPSGGPARVFAADYDGLVASNFMDLTGDLFPATNVGTLGLLSSLGEDARGELYFVDIGDGEVFRLVGVPEPGSLALLGVGVGVLWTQRCLARRNRNHVGRVLAR